LVRTAHCSQQEGRPIRYYRITITDADGKLWTPPGTSSSLLGGASYTSFINNKTIAEALDINLDLPIIGIGTPQGYGSVSIWGVSIQEINQAQNLSGKNMKIEAGFKDGLPLAKSEQSGVVFEGMIYQCFGNWIGTDMRLDFIITPCASTPTTIGGTGLLDKPRQRNFTLEWPGGTQLSDAIRNCLNTAYPGYNLNIEISSAIVSRQKDRPTGYYSTLGQFAQDVMEISKSIIDPRGETGYPGVSIVPHGTTIDIFDGPNKSSQTKEIKFNELIGQPTWIDYPLIQFKTPMRADLSVSQQITLPKTQVINTTAAFSNQVNQNATFKGGFWIQNMRHVGSYRQTMEDAWVTVIEAAPLSPVEQTGTTWVPGNFP